MCGCSLSKESEKPDDALLREYLENIDKFETPVCEVGSPTSYIYMQEGMSVGILYPETEYKFLDEAIYGWVDKLAHEYIEEVQTIKGATAELTVHYESFLAGEEIVSIEMQGTFFASYMSHPIDVIKTFNADIGKKKLINIRDILRTDSYEGFEALVLSRSGAAKEDIDEHFLDNAVITKEGIEIILRRGDYLPMSEGTKTVTFEYGEISGMLRKAFIPEDEKPAEDKEGVTFEDEGQRQDIDPDKPMLALTFDDGPSAHTDRLLDIFNRYGGKATFFVLGNLIDGRKSTLIRISEEGHEIGNHSWNHRQFTNLSEKETEEQIMMTRSKIYDVTGKDCKIVRPPYGACNDDVRKVGKKLGVSFVNWSVDTLDWKTKNAKAVYNEIMKDASDGAIILCHDLHKTTVDAMEKVVPELISRGYQLVTVSQLMEYSGKKTEPGKMYYRG